MFASLISMLDCEKGIIWNRDIVGLGWGDGGLPHMLGGLQWEGSCGRPPLEASFGMPFLVEQQ